MAIVLGFFLGAVAGLLARPLLDAYLYWKTAERYRQDDTDDATRFDRDVGSAGRSR